jgi:hypothetical protein
MHRQLDYDAMLDIRVLWAPSGWIRLELQSYQWGRLSCMDGWGQTDEVPTYLLFTD